MNEEQMNGNELTNPSKGLATASMVCGIVALVLSCCVPFLPIALGGLAVVLGWISISKKMAGKGMAIAGVVTGIIALVPNIIVSVFVNGVDEFFSMFG